jgi:hypothetical protein
MKSLRIFLISLSVGLFIISCQKEHITTTNTTVGSPVFYFNGTVGSNNVSLQAGKSNYYMYSSYSQNSAGVYSFIGNLKEFGCSSNCVSSIEFIINNYRTRPSGAAETYLTDSALTATSYNYASPGGTSTKYLATFYPTLGSVPKKYTFTFGDGSILNGTNSPPPPQIQHAYSHPGNYSTNLSVVFDSTHTSSLSNQLNLGIPVNNITAFLTFNDSISPVLYNVSINGGQGPYKTHWDFGDPLSNSQDSTNRTNVINWDSASHLYVSQLQHLVTVTITDANKLTVTANANMVPGLSNRAYLARYSMATPSPVSNSSELSNVTIIYTDPSGDVYTTADSSQNIGSNFQVVSVAPYNNNENNQTTKQLHIKFNCTLYDNKGKSLTITGGDAVIAMAYK